MVLGLQVVAVPPMKVVYPVTSTGGKASPDNGEGPSQDLDDRPPSDGGIWDGTNPDVLESEKPDVEEVRDIEKKIVPVCVLYH